MKLDGINRNSVTPAKEPVKKSSVSIDISEDKRDASPSLHPDLIRVLA
jgi:hypothetical protein